MKLTNYLGDRGFWRVTSQLALPIALQNVLTSSFQLVDTMMVSRLGDMTLSAVGMAGQWGWMCTLICFGVCSGLSMFVAQYWGVRDLKGIRRSLGMALLISVVLSLGFMAVALGNPRFVVGLFNEDPAVVDIGTRYLTIVCLSYPATMLTNVMAVIPRNTEQVTTPLYVSIITTILNAVANYGLIFGNLGMPELGVEGAAIATCISAWAGPVLLLLISWRQRNLLIGPIRELLDFTWKDMVYFIRRISPVIFNEGLWALGVVVTNAIYSNLGYEYYAGMTIFKTFSDLAFAFYVGLGNACVIMVGKSVGQGKIERAVQDAVRFSVLVPLAGVVIGGLSILLRTPLISIFSTGENLSALTLQTAQAVLIFCSLEVVLQNVPYVQIVGIFRSGGDTLSGMIMDMVCLWVVSIPVAWLAANVLHLPFLAVVICARLAEDLPKTFLCLWHFRSKRWLKPVTKEGRAGLAAYLGES